MSKGSHVVIVGAGHGGGNLAALLRRAGFAGIVTLIGDEQVLPYHRPPLSKAYLKGSASADDLELRPEKFYADQSVVTRLGARVETIDRAAKRVHFTGGDSLDYDLLVLATGSRPRELPIPGIDLDGLAVLRTLADADGLRELLAPGRRVAMIGGGYIGLEVAASSIGLGGSAGVIEREQRILARVASPLLSGYITDYHRDRGVEISVDAQVTAIDGEGGHVAAVVLADGRRQPCDGALICVGGVACDELARAAGLDCDGGIVVDLKGRTSDPSIFAIGDVTKRPLPLHDHRMFRPESVPMPSNRRGRSRPRSWERRRAGASAWAMRRCWTRW